MISYYQVIQNAMNIYYNRDQYAYFYGAKGQRLTMATMDALIACEPGYFHSRYRDEQLEAIKKFSLNRIGLDCSGFVNACTGQQNYSTGYYTDTLNKTTPKKGKEGSLLYTTWSGQGRHVGIDIGYGYYLDFRKEGESCHFGKIAATNWEHSGELKDVDYTGAKS